MDDSTSKHLTPTFLYFAYGTELDIEHFDPLLGEVELAQVAPAGGLGPRLRRFGGRGRRGRCTIAIAVAVGAPPCAASASIAAIFAANSS